MIYMVQFSGKIEVDAESSDEAIEIVDELLTSGELDYEVLAYPN